MSSINTNQAIILFDGVCNFCNSKINYVIRHDKYEYFRFSTLQSKTGIIYLEKYNIPKHLDTIILIEAETVFTQSTAALRIARKLHFPHNIWYILIIVPPFIRNFFYNYIARNRYKWWGKLENCMIPSPSVKKRFLE